MYLFSSQVKTNLNLLFLFMTTVPSWYSWGRVLSVTHNTSTPQCLLIPVPRFSYSPVSSHHLATSSSCCVHYYQPHCVFLSPISQAPMHNCMLPPISFLFRFSFSIKNEKLGLIFCQFYNITLIICHYLLALIFKLLVSII